MTQNSSILPKALRGKKEKTKKPVLGKIDIKFFHKSEGPFLHGKKRQGNIFNTLIHIQLLSIEWSGEKNIFWRLSSFSF